MVHIITAFDRIQQGHSCIQDGWLLYPKP